MQADKVFRISQSGIVFLIAWLFWYYAFGGDMHVLLQLVPDASFDSIVALLGLLLATPVVGSMTSAIGWGIIFYWCNQRHRIHLSERQSNVAGERVDEFYWNHQRLIRERLNDRTFKFLEDRWGSFHVHSNNVTSIVLALWMGIFTASGWNDPNLCVRFCSCPAGFFVMPMLLLIIAYMIFAILACKRARLDAVEVEDRSAQRAWRQDTRDL